MKKIIIILFTILILTIFSLLLYFKFDSNDKEFHYQFNINSLTWWILQDTISDQDL